MAKPPITIGEFTNAPDVGSRIIADWAQMATRRVVQQFFTVAERDAKWAPQGCKGALCVTLDVLRVWQSTGSAWVLVGGSMPRVLVRGTATPQSVASGAGVAAAWSVEDYDTDNVHDNVTNNSRFTIPAAFAGRWRFDYCVSFAANATGGRSTWIDHPLAGRLAEVDMAGSAAYPNTHTGSAEGLCSAGYVITVTVQHNAGAALNVNGNPTTNYFGAQYMGPS